MRYKSFSFKHVQQSVKFSSSARTACAMKFFAVFLLVVVGAQAILGFAADRYLTPDGERYEPEEEDKDLTTDDSSPTQAWEESGYVEGDMILSPDDRNSILTLSSYWPNGILYYDISPAFNSNSRSVILATIDWFNKNTCIKMKQRTNQANYVRIGRKSEMGCFGSVGMTGRGEQDLNLGKNCVVQSVIAHEFLHALGFFHMQNAVNRDKYVTILWDNIDGDDKMKLANFGIKESYSFGVSYDYGSILHYRRNAFAFPGKDTIVPKDPKAVIGMAKIPSAKDLQKLSAMYKC